VTGLSRLVGTTAFKLSLAYMLVAALFAGGLIAYVGASARGLIDAQIGQTLSAQINGLSDQYRIGGLRRLQTIIERRSAQPGSFLFLVQGPGGETLAGNITGLVMATAQPDEAVEATYQRIEEGEGGTTSASRAALVKVMQLPGNNRLLVGRDLEERERLNTVLNQAIRWLILTLVGFGGVGAFFVARRVLARMDAMTDTTQRIMAGDLSGRLPVSGSGDELDRLAQSLNAMLVRIGELMQGMKEVSDNVAHDLRTPLTRLRNSAEAALRGEGSKADYRQALERVIEESDGLIATFNALLMIARAEAGSGADAFRPVDVGALLADVQEMYEPVAEDAGVVLTADVPPDLKVEGSRELLSQAVANLIDNALKYGHPEGRAPTIHLTAMRSGERVVLSVADNGAGIPPAHCARAVERFARLDESRSKPGSGLGLSLVAAVAHLHRGQLRLEPGEPGLCAVIDLPVLA
jgi:signal transduction histidine kinase